MSQVELARKAGLSTKGMAYIERGHIEDPHLSSIIRIAGALGLSVDQLLAWGEPPSPKRLCEIADALENIIERQRKRVEKWAEEGEVPLEGPLEMDAFCDAIYRFFKDTRIANAADALWNAAPLDEEEEEARRHAGRILEGMFHLNGVVAEAYNTRRRLLKDIPEEIPALIREVEEKLERARRQQYRQVNG